MGLDLRIPIGLLFSIFGVMLVAYGLINPAGSVSQDVNINLGWGLVQLVFGLVMLLLSWLGARKQKSQQ